MTPNHAIIRETCIRLANGDLSKALDLAIADLDYWRLNCSAGFVRESPSSVREPKLPPEPILTHGGK